MKSINIIQWDQLTKTAKSIADGKGGDVKAWALGMIHLAASMPYSRSDYSDERENLLWWNITTMDINPAEFLEAQDVAIAFMGPGAVEPNRFGSDLDQLLDKMVMLPIRALTYDKEAANAEAQRKADAFLKEMFGE